MTNRKWNTYNNLAEPLVSVIIPVYNSEEFLPECIESVIRQNYNNIEVLLVDDGSTDNSGMICDDCAQIDSRIKVYHKKNGGLSSARNFGLLRAQGDWIAFVDSDDWIAADMIGTMIDAAQRNDAELCICSFSLSSQRKKRYLHVVQKEQRFSGTSKTDAYFRGAVLDVSWNKLYKKELFQEIRFPEGRNFEDIVTTYRVLQTAELIVCIPECLYFYRQNNNGISKSHTLKNESDRWLSCKELMDIVDPDFPQYHVKLVRNVMIGIWRTWLSFCGASAEEKHRYRDRIESMQTFVREHSAEILHGPYSFKDKVKLMFVFSNNPLFQKILYCFSLMVYKFRTRYYF